MKKIIFIVTAFSLALTIRGQTLERSVFGAAGKVDVGKTMQLEWTLGEVAVSRYAHSGAEINEGFHQPYLTVERDETRTIADQRFSVFPNPTGADLFVQAKLSTNEQVQLKLIDSAGRLLLPVRRSGHLVNEQLDLQHIPAGHYYLLLSDARGKLLHSVKILKQ